MAVPRPRSRPGLWLREKRPPQTLHPRQARLTRCSPSEPFSETWGNHSPRSESPAVICPKRPPRTPLEKVPWGSSGRLERELLTPRSAGAWVWEEANGSRARHRLKSNPWNLKPQMTLGALQTPADSADTPAVTGRAGKRLEPWCIMYFYYYLWQKEEMREKRAESKQPNNSSI